MTARMDEKILNAQTVTTSDFSLKMEIPLNVYKEWQSHSTDMAFDDWFQAKIEAEIAKIDCSEHAKAQVASMHFCYDN